MTKKKTILSVVILICTVVAQLALSLKYFTSNDQVGGFISLATAIIWFVVAFTMYKSPGKKK